MNFRELWLRGEAAQSDAINVQRIYIDINDGNLTDGVMFSQIMYWHGYDRQGKTRLKVKKGGHLWLVKRYGDWWDECRVNEHTARKSIERIIERGLLVKAIFKFDGAPTVHIRVNWPEFEKRTKFIWHNRSDGSDKNGQMEMTPEVRTITETTTETTTDIYPEPPIKRTKKRKPVIIEPDAAMFAEVIELVDIPPALLTPGKKNDIDDLVLGLMELENGPGEVTRFGQWWYKHDWRGQRKQKPTLTNIRELWQQFKDNPNGIESAQSGNGHRSDLAENSPYGRLVAAEHERLRAILDGQQSAA